MSICEAIFQLVFIPNFTFFIFIFFLGLVWIISFLINFLLIRFGFLRNDNIQRRQRTNRIKNFKEKYISKLKKIFYYENNERQIEINSAPIFEDFKEDLTIDHMLLNNLNTNENNYQKDNCLYKSFNFQNQNIYFEHEKIQDFKSVKDLQLNKFNLKKNHNYQLEKQTVKDFMSERSFNTNDISKFWKNPFINRKKSKCQSNLSKDNDICSICFSEFKKFSSIVKMPECYHVFHYDCILLWFDRNTTCPICRLNLYDFFNQKPNN